MREDLLGYLLSSLEPHEMRRIERELSDNPSLQEELAIVQQTIAPLDRAIGALPLVQTPPDLIARAMAALPAFEPTSESEGSAMSPATDGRRSHLASWSDILVAGLASAAVLAFLIPSIARGRYEARRVACQENLRQLGTAITQYVMLNRQESLPQIAEQGPFAFAGMFEPRLVESGLFPVQDARWCPEAKLPTLITTNGEAESVFNRLVHIDDLQAASDAGKVDELRRLQQVAGGHYSYTLGVVDNDRYEAPHYESRATFAVLGDSPIAGTEVSESVDASRLRWGHRDNGANVLFEDGSVRFMNMSGGSQLPDHPYFNHRGSMEAGVNIDDASLAPSWFPPFIDVRQR